MQPNTFPIHPQAQVNTTLQQHPATADLNHNFSAFIKELRTTLNEKSFTPIKVTELHKKYHFHAAWMNFLVKREFIQLEKKSRRFCSYKLTPKFGEVTADRMKGLYDKSLQEIATDNRNRYAAKQKLRKLKSCVKSRLDEVAPVELSGRKLHKLTPTPDPVLPEPVEVTGSPALDIIVEIPAVTTILQPVIPGISKSLEMNWKMDNQAYRVSIQVEGPDGADYSQILRKGLVLLDINC